MTAYSVSIQGVAGIRKALRPLLEPQLSRELDAATKKSAQTFAKAVRAEVAPLSKHMARAVRVKRAKRDRPGWVVGSRRKIAFWWPFVIVGTEDHGPRKAKQLVFIPGWNPYLGTSSHGVGNKVIRTSKVRGVRANAAVERAARRVEGVAFRDAEQQFDRDTGL